LTCLPLARARLRRLPRPQDAATPDTRDDPAGRQAAVTAFLSEIEADPAASDGPQPDVVRFWAEVLAGYAGVVPGTSPTLVGPLRLAHIMLGYVPSMFELTPAQRHGMPAAVAAWAAWAATRQGLDDTARARIQADLPTVLGAFDDTYDRSDAARQRGYLRDVSATTADGRVLAATLARRSIALPAPTEDPPLHAVDVSDPAVRRAVIEDSYRGCDPPPGMSGADFVAAAADVSEQLWCDDPPQLWQAALRLVADGVPGHEIIHHLVRGAATTR
jgi:hypothetical protein